MEGALKLWLVILAVGALNYLSRLSFIAVFGRRSMPAWLARSLKFVPAAMLTALILPMIVGTPPSGAAEWAQPKVVAAVAAVIVAYFTHSTPKTLAAGMLVLWLLQWAIGSAAPGA
jgi:branched-subunit amino acid transport protein